MECLSMSETDRVVLGRREAMEVLWNKLQHQQTSPGNANAVTPPPLPYMYTRLIPTLKEEGGRKRLCKWRRTLQLLPLCAAKIKCSMPNDVCGEN